jgi:putative ABC transport system permease protein
VKDVKYGLRALRKTAGVTTVATITIALGIAACTTIFSVVNGVLLRPLPYSEPERVALVWSELRARNVLDFPFPIPDVRDFRQDTTAFEDVAGITGGGRVTLAGDTDNSEQVRSVGVTPNLFRVLGVRPLYGRDFTDDDGTLPPPSPQPVPGAGGPPPGPQPLPVIAMLSHEFWQRRFGGDPAVVGMSIRIGINGRAEIVGVLPANFRMLLPPRTGFDPNVDLWTAMRLNYDTAARNTGALRVVGRLKPGVSYQQAQEDAARIAASFRDRFPVKKTAGVHFRVVPVHEDLVKEVRPTVLALFGAVIFVLLIACANVANLLIVRASARQRELVIRAAIGSSRWQLVRQMLIEAGLLSTFGAALGVILSVWALATLVALAPARIPRIDAIRLDINVLLFTIAAAALTALICGLVPALRASRQNAADVLRVGGGAPGLRAGRRLRAAVVVTEVALSFVLVVGAGLMVRSVIALQRIYPGYDATNVLTFVLPAARPQAEQRAAFMTQVRDRLRALPGVQAVAATSSIPLDGSPSNIPYAPEEVGSTDPSAFRQAKTRNVTPAYFETLRSRLIAGRTFTDDDNLMDRASKVVVDDVLAAQAYPGTSPVGRWLLVRNLGAGPDAPQNVRMEIIGVVAHQRHESLAAPGREGIYFIDAYVGFGSATKWLLRTNGDPSALVPAVRAAVREIDPRAVLAEVQPMAEFVERASGPTEFAATLIGLFGFVALAMAAVGLYALLSTTVRLRTPELGMRMVCGANRARILGLVFMDGLRLSGMGLALGLAAALLVTKTLESMLVAISPTDPLTFSSIGALFLVIVAIAALIPARRAAALDPLVAIREEN